MESLRRGGNKESIHHDYFGNVILTQQPVHKHPSILTDKNPVPKDDEAQEPRLFEGQKNDDGIKPHGSHLQAFEKIRISQRLNRESSQILVSDT